MKRKTILGIFTATCLMSAHASAQDAASLTVSFADSTWDGVTIPDGQHCSRFEGSGSSPALLVENIPSDANALIVSFSDRSFKPNDNGGHGIVGIWVEDGQTSVTVASVPGETNDMPDGMFIEEKFRSNRGSDGAYLPPCSGGRGNEYYATVTAVYKENAESEAGEALAEASIEMGKY